MSVEFEAALIRESHDPRPGVWWLSFADDGQWLGGCYVEAIGPVHAVQRTHELGINPGGQVAIMGAVSRERFDEIAPSVGAQMDRLLTQDDLDDLQEWPEDLA